MRVFLRDDAEIREAVVRDVVVEALDTKRDAIEVAVAGGVVTLSGAMDHATAAAYAVRATREVPGVIDVVDKLSWTLDDSNPVGPNWSGSLL